MKTYRHISPLLTLALVTALASGQSHDTQVTLSGTFFGPQESQDYLSAYVSHRFTRDLSVDLRYGSSPRTTDNFGAFTLTHGGTDAELIGYYRVRKLPGLTVGLGVSLPDVPDRPQAAFGTFDIYYRRSLTAGNETSLGVKGIESGEAIVMPYVAFTQGQGHGLDLYGDAGIPVVGDNARSTTTGNTYRGMVGTIGLRWHKSIGVGDGSVAIAFTNELGITTGLSMTPSLGNSFGPSLTFGYRF